MAGMLRLYTEGPWHESNGIIFDESGCFIADTNNSILTPEERSANARLLACAPELLRFLHDLISEDESGNLCCRIDIDLEAARELADKAEDRVLLKKIRDKEHMDEVYARQKQISDEVMNEKKV